MRGAITAETPPLLGEDSVVNALTPEQEAQLQVEQQREEDLLDKENDVNADAFLDLLCPP